MATDNTSQVNSFGKGMNSDLSYSMIGDGQYTFAKNIRITALNLTGKGDITNGQGAVRPIEGVSVHNTVINASRVLATNSIRNIGVVVYVDKNDDHWKVGVFKNGSTGITPIYDSGESTNAKKLSTVVHYEAADLVKLYIADGLNPIRALNIVTGEAESGEEFEQVSVESTEQYPNIIFKPLKFRGLILGTLQPGMVLYAYRLYIKHGVTTDMSPVTNLIPLVYPDTSKGELQNESINAGVRLLLQVDDEYRNVFDHIIIYRIYYPQNDVQPTISVFKDEELSKLPNGFVDDTGGISLLDITVEEFNNMTGTHIIPKILENKNDILFAAATRDSLTSAFEDITDEDTTSELEYEFVKIDLIGDSSKNEGGYISHNTIDRQVNDASWDLGSDINGTELKEDILASVKNNNYTYSDPAIVHYARSLRRGETYRYGVVYYNIRGESSGVTHITDVYVGNKGDGDHGLSALGDPFTFTSGSKYELEVHSIGVKFKNIPVPASAVAYEIVRCRRDITDTVNISQGVISRPVTRYKWSDTSNAVIGGYPYTPTGFLTMQDFYMAVSQGWSDSCLWMNPTERETVNWKDNSYHADNYDNHSLLLFVSPEVCYAKDDMSKLMQNGQLKLQILNNLYCDTGIATTTLSTSRYKYLLQLDEQPYSQVPDNYIQYPAAPHNANLIMWQRLNSNLYRIGIDYNRHPMTFYSAKAGDYVIDRADVYSGLFTFVDPTNESVTTGSTRQVKDSVIRRITGDDLYMINKIKPYSYAYIKLYNKEGYSRDINNVKINNFAMAGEYGPLDLYTTDNSTTVANYTNNATVVGTNEYCNVVAGGFYGETNDDFINTNGNAFDGHADDLLFIANGGRCMVVNLDQNIPVLHTNDITTPNYLYTHLCNITRDIEPYGGNGDTAKKLCTYYSHGQYFIPTNKGNDVDRIVFDGDTYIVPLEYVSMHKALYALPTNTVASSCVVYSIPVETSINLSYTSGFEFSNEYKNITNSALSITNIQIEANQFPAEQTGLSRLTQEEPLYEYNMAYSSDSKSTYSSSRTDSEDAELFEDMDYRIYYSDRKINGELTDSWLKFDANNFIDVDTKHGPVTHMRDFHNKLMFWQEKAMGVLSVNERAVVSVNENTATDRTSTLPLVLGTGGVLERYDYLDDTAGMEPEQYCDAISPSTLYWYDDSNKEIRAYTDGSGIIPLTKLGGVLNIMHQYDDDNIPWMFYDHKYNEVVLDLKSDHGMSIVYNEQIRAFTSVYDIGFDGAIKFKNGLYLLNLPKDGNLLMGEWNKSDVPTGFEGPLISLILYVVNKFPLVTKVFDNQELVSIYGGETEDRYSYFTDDHTYRWKTDLMDTGGIENLNMTLREGNYRYAIPRELNADYGSRMRGKYMICDIYDTSPKKDASLAFVITKFRTSWI